MRIKRIGVATVFLVASACAVKLPRAQTKDPYQGIPAGYDFPADQSTLLRFRDTNDVIGMRRHAWMVFAGLTQPVATGEALWETWYPGRETFAPTAPSPARPRRIEHRFQVPRQFFGGQRVFALGNSVLSFTLFNLPAYSFIRNNLLYQPAQLKRLLDALPADTPIAQREMAPFSPDSVALKTVWWIVKKNLKTPVPVWDGEPTGPNGQPAQRNRAYDYTQFGRCALVDPLNHEVKPDETEITDCNGKRVKAHVVTLDKFYRFPLDQNAINTIDNPPPLPHVGDRNTIPEVGDYAVLVGMHCTTKEIPDWVWSTFWWHDKPDDGPFATDRPPAVTGVWRNYLMSVSYSMTTPLEPDGSPHIAFNPWLEGPFSDGVQSNCMTCHVRSVWPSIDEDRNKVRRGEPDPNDTLFKNGIKLDFIWSFAIESLELR